MMVWFTNEIVGFHCSAVVNDLLIDAGCVLTAEIPRGLENLYIVSHLKQARNAANDNHI